MRYVYLVLAISILAGCQTTNSSSYPEYMEKHNRLIWADPHP